jgi:hypothetical protein
MMGEGDWGVRPWARRGDTGERERRREGLHLVQGVSEATDLPVQIVSTNDVTNP